MAAGTTSGMTHRKTAASSAKTPSAAIGWASRRSRRGRALPSLCLAGLALGPSDPDRAQAEGAGVAGRCFGGQLADARERLDLRPRPRLHRRSPRRPGLSAPALHPRRPALQRPGHGAAAVGQAGAEDRQQRISRYRPHLQQRLRRHRRQRAGLLPGAAARGDRTPQRTHLSCGQQRRVPCWLRHSPGRLRGGLRPVVRGAGLPGRLARRTPLPGRRIPDRGRYPPVHHPGALRCGVPRTLQVQPAAHRRLPESLRLVARAVPTPGHRRDSGLRTYQGTTTPATAPSTRPG